MKRISLSLSKALLRPADRAGRLGQRGGSRALRLPRTRALVTQSFETPRLRAIIASIAMLGLFALPGCTWVAVTPQAESVRIAPSDGLEGCTPVGTTKARTKTKVGIFSRSEKKIAQELETLARNDAPELGGNTVIAEGPVSAEGMQRFAIYDCPVETRSAP